MSDDTSAGPPAAPPRRRSRRRKILIGTAAALALILAAAAGIVAVAARKLEGNITARDILRELGSDRPTAEPPPTSGPTRALNIVLIGSDARAGNEEYGQDVYDGARSDTTIVLHLSADRRRAYAVSIPRDSWVRLPDCVGNDGRQLPPKPARFNEAFRQGGPGCTVRAVEQLTDIRIDHYAVVDFRGFVTMVDALGGVDVCVPQAIDDRDARLTLRAGQQRLDGRQALGYVRVRKIGTGSDLARIERQQQFLSAMVRKATSTGLLTNPVRLYRFLDAATKSLTTDPGLADLGALRDLAMSLRGIGLDRVSFLTVPNVPNPRDANTVVWERTRSAAVWRALDTDGLLPGEAPIPVGGRATPVPRVSVAPSSVRVRVLDGSGTPGAGDRAAADLRRVGFRVTSVGASSRGVARTEVRYDPGYDESARTLGASVPGSALIVAPELGRTLEVVVGSDYAGVRRVTVAAPLGSGGIDRRTAADENPCRSG